MGNLQATYPVQTSPLIHFRHSKYRQYSCRVIWKDLWWTADYYRFFKYRRGCTIPLFQLKGQCHEIFCFWFFPWIIFPPAPEYSLKNITNFFENSRRYSQVKVHRRYQRHRRQIFPPVLTTPVANFHRYQRHQRQICHQCKQHQWQTMRTIIKLMTI